MLLIARRVRAGKPVEDWAHLEAVARELGGRLEPQHVSKGSDEDLSWYSL